MQQKFVVSVHGSNARAKAKEAIHKPSLQIRNPKSEIRMTKVAGVTRCTRVRHSALEFLLSFVIWHSSFIRVGGPKGCAKAKGIVISRPSAAPAPSVPTRCCRRDKPVASLSENPPVSRSRHPRRSADSDPPAGTRSFALAPSRDDRGGRYGTRRAYQIRS